MSSAWPKWALLKSFLAFNINSVGCHSVNNNYLVFRQKNQSQDKMDHSISRRFDLN